MESRWSQGPGPGTTLPNLSGHLSPLGSLQNTYCLLINGPAGFLALEVFQGDEYFLQAWRGLHSWPGPGQAQGRIQPQWVTEYYTNKYSFKMSMLKWRIQLIFSDFCRAILEWISSSDEPLGFLHRKVGYREHCRVQIGCVWKCGEGKENYLTTS